MQLADAGDLQPRRLVREHERSQCRGARLEPPGRVVHLSGQRGALLLHAYRHGAVTLNKKGGASDEAPLSTPSRNQWALGPEHDLVVDAVECVLGQALRGLDVAVPGRPADT